MTRRTLNSPVLTASEIGQFFYCQRSWWISRVGVESVVRQRLHAERAELEAMVEIHTLAEQDTSALRERIIRLDEQLAQHETIAIPDPPDLDEGTVYHVEHGYRAWQSRAAVLLAGLLIAAAVLLIVLELAR